MDLEIGSGAGVAGFLSRVHLPVRTQRPVSHSSKTSTGGAITKVHTDSVIRSGLKPSGEYPIAQITTMDQMPETAIQRRIATRKSYHIALFTVDRIPFMATEPSAGTR